MPNVPSISFWWNSPIWSTINHATVYTTKHSSINLLWQKKRNTKKTELKKAIARTSCYPFTKCYIDDDVEWFPYLLVYGHFTFVTFTFRRQQQKNREIAFRCEYWLIIFFYCLGDLYLIFEIYLFSLFISFTKIYSNWTNLFVVRNPLFSPSPHFKFTPSRRYNFWYFHSFFYRPDYFDVLEVELPQVTDLYRSIFQ